MAATGHWIRLLALAAAYAAAFAIARRAIPFSIESPWFVCLAMVCFLGLAFMARPVVPVRMPGFLRRVRDWEAKGRLYRRLGVHGFGRLLRRTPLRLLNRDVYLSGALQSGAGLSTQLEAAEASHFWAALLVVPYMFRLCLQGRWQALFWVAVAQVLINVYPIMHLRLARLRVDRALTRRPMGRRRTAR